MNKCDVYIGTSKEVFQGQYELDSSNLEVEIFNYHSSSDEFTPLGSTVKYKEITIVDLRNKVFIFSPVFYNIGMTYSLTQYEKYRTDFYAY